MDAAKPIGVIKKEWPDFQVMESGLQLVFKTSLDAATSRFTRFALTKRGMETDKAIEEVSNQLNVPLEAITTCGRKDSFAETVQEIVVAGPYRPTFSHGNIWLRRLGAAPGPLALGNHKGNTFRIKVYTEFDERLRGTSFKNYFGYQRFGGGNVEVGRYLIEGDFEKAFDLWEGTRTQPLRDRMYSNRVGGSYLTKAAVVLHPALRSACKTSIQGWQSHLWNCLAADTTVKYHGERLPMWDELNAWRYEKWWDPTGYVDQMLDLAYSFDRPLLAVAENLTSTRIDGGWLYSFKLRSGAFATTFLGSHFDLQDKSVERFEARREAQKASM